MSSSSWTNQTLPDPDDWVTTKAIELPNAKIPLNERVTTKAIELPNAKILHIYEGVHKCPWHNVYTVLVVLGSGRRNDNLGLLLCSIFAS